MPTSTNFTFLATHDAQLERLAALAERYLSDDPATCLIKLRQFGELLSQHIEARLGLPIILEERQDERLRRLSFEPAMPGETLRLLHQLRRVGNRATHAYEGTHNEALANLKVARQAAIWFQRTFFDAAFAAGSFVPPANPAEAAAGLQAELTRLQSELRTSRNEAEQALLYAEAALQARREAEQQASLIREERAVWETLATEADQQRANLFAQLQALHDTALAAPPQEMQRLIARAETAAQQIDLDEATTRALIDEQLRLRGWQADTASLRYSLGTRPAAGSNMAIAEWPTPNGPADYALFTGTQCVAFVEAKRRRRNVSAAIDQAQRYASPPLESSATAGPFAVPFVFATNGRPYLRQLATESGIWFRDLRRSTNLPRPLADWPTPAGLQAWLGIDVDAAQAKLANQPIELAFPLRPYQRRAIAAVEGLLASDRRTMLLAMATGTGKTKLAIALLYRLLSTNRFHRVCFVVDRSALGNQASNEFSTTRMAGSKAFADIFGLQGLETSLPDPETRVHICTIQGLVKRVLYADDPASVPSVDQYDLMIIDECHRGYLLDREMSETELSFRSQDDYISKYRRVLEHFDAVKIGLTATPALHTVTIFGQPVFTYSYREAVIDGYLIDHEPPIRIVTVLAEQGIAFARDEPLELLNTATGEVDLALAPDDLRFEVEQFNRQVITRPFNEALANELTNHLDPNLPGKTLIFAATDKHADLLVDELRKAFERRYGSLEYEAIKKITGSAENPLGLLRAFRNDRLPSIVVTVDLLTTGVDIPAICNLVFVRRVNSRILYEQMLGRATRRCDEIGKELFRVFDAVDLYAHVQQVSTMRPVASDPQLHFAQLFAELSSLSDPQQQALVRDQLVAKWQRRLRTLPAEAREHYTALTGETPEASLLRLRNEPLAASSAWTRQQPELGAVLDWESPGTPRQLPIAPHPDEVIRVEQGYGNAERPEDYLESFADFVRSNLNQVAALGLVVQRPRELTRAELRNLRLALDGLGYSESNLRRAWSAAKNEDIAASIIGYVRHAALGDALRPFAERVGAAMNRIVRSRQWNTVQRGWLQRIQEQILREVVIDRTTFEEEPFARDGGFQRLDRVFEGNLTELLAEINGQLWEHAA
jgi:type I restriction enzyme, R subunit